MLVYEEIVMDGKRYLVRVLSVKDAEGTEIEEGKEGDLYGRRERRFMHDSVISRGG